MTVRGEQPSSEPANSVSGTTPGSSIASQAPGPGIGHKEQRGVALAGDFATETSLEAALDFAGVGGPAAWPVPPASDTEARQGSSGATPPAAGRMPDPLADPADVVWYVRPPSGGQFGPASRDLMKLWITEGRVTADSLVWREGWRDWREAQSVLPQFTTSEVEPELEAMIAEEVFSPRIRTGRRAAKKRSRLSLGPGVVLTIAVALALSVLAVLWIWFHMS